MKDLLWKMVNQAKDNNCFTDEDVAWALAEWKRLLQEE